VIYHQQPAKVLPGSFQATYEATLALFIPNW
jgi:hypothetical protein